MAIVYLLTNTVNGKKYVGKTVRSLDIRWQEHVNCSKYHSTLHIHKAIRKYGSDSFSKEIIEECDNNNASNREVFWIETFNTFYHGYNMTKGGEGVEGFIHSKESNEKNRLSHIGRTQSEKTCSLKSKSMLASKNVKRKSVVSIDNLNNKRVFESLSEAERFLNKPGSSTLISRCCRGKTKKAYGFRWKYLEEKDFNISPVRKKRW